jgi:hypothetical protein
MLNVSLRAVLFEWSKFRGLNGFKFRGRQSFGCGDTRGGRYGAEAGEES